MQPAAAQELAHDALRVGGRFGCSGGSIDGRAVRVQLMTGIKKAGIVRARTVS